MRITAVLFAAMATLLGVGAAAAIEAPSGPALVTISGSIANTNLDGKLVLDEKAIEALPFTTVRTETPWTEGVVTFESVPLKALLDFAGATGSVVHAVALNDYAVDVPISDTDNPKVILAYRLNGERMPVRKYGPLWLVYPLSDSPGLQGKETHSKMIWQIKELEIR